jgi:uracil-DNA glycosylase family 4
MNAKIEILHGLKKSLEFYRELGFERFPVKLDKMLKNTEDKKDEKISLMSDKECSPGNQKEKALRALRAEIGDCQRCRLSKGRKNLVFGEGDPDADILFVGEGPGREEDRQGRPFVGDAGKVLTNLIRKMGLKREDVYIANVVKCRPPMNRDPEQDEILTCSPFLEKQIEIIRPQVIMALGRVSSQRLVGSMIPISKLRGKFYDFKGIPLMPTFHPAYLIRNPKDKWLTWNDAQKVLEKLKG